MFSTPSPPRSIGCSDAEGLPWGSDNQAERAIEASELQEFMAGVMANYPDKQLAAPDDRHFIARRIIEAMRKEGRRWSI